MPGNIFSRMESQVHEMENITWRCRLDKACAIIDYIDPQCVLISPSDGLVSPKTSPSTKQMLQAQTGPTFSSFEMHDVVVVEISMMGATICYRVTATRVGATGQMENYRAFCSSTWKQGADGEWTLCVHQQSPY